MMRQLVVSYKFQDNLTWSDGEPVKQADFELAYANDCNEESGAVDYSTCRAIESVEFTGDTAFTVTYKPGYFAPLSFISPIGLYPSHQVLSDGRVLADVPTTEWSSLHRVVVAARDRRHAPGRRPVHPHGMEQGPEPCARGQSLLLGR